MSGGLNDSYAFQSVAPNVGVFIVFYDPYHPEQARKQIAQFDATRIIDAPHAQVAVIIPNYRLHTESGSRVDIDVLRHGVDVVGVFDSDSARRVGKALSGSGVRVVLLPAPRMRDVVRHNELNDQRKLLGKAAMIQLMYNVTAEEARQIAANISSFPED
jgi:hypothetical protein